MPLAMTLGEFLYPLAMSVYKLLPSIKPGNKNETGITNHEFYLRMR